MISNDIILNISSITMLALLIAWGGCFFIFVYKNIGGPKVGRDSFLYFNFIFFKKNFLSSLSLVLIFFAYMAAALMEYRRGFDEIMLVANIVGGASLLLYGVYGRFFYSGTVEDLKPFFFIKVFLSKFDFSIGSIFLWLSRLTYITWVFMFFRNGLE